MHVMRSKPRRRRGISTVIAGTIIILLIIVGVVPLLTLYLSTAQTVLNTYNIRSTYEELKRLESTTANVSDNILTIVNDGPVPIDASFITLSNSEGTCSIVLNLFDYINTTIPDPIIDSANITINSVQRVIRIEPGGYIKLNITPLTQEGAEDVCSVVTAKGNIIEVSKVGTATVVEKARAIIVTPIMLDVATLANRTDIAVNETQIQPATPSNSGGGMSRMRSDGNGISALTRYAYIKSNTSTSNVHLLGGDDPLDTSGVWIPFNNIYIGYNPEWSKAKTGQPRYNILITGYVSLEFMVFKEGAVFQFYNQSYSTYHGDKGNYYLFWLYKETSNICYRIKIINYIPSSGHLQLKYDADHDGSLDLLIDDNALGYWWLYSETYAPQGYFELNGTASEVVVYIDASDMGYDEIVEASYDPYIFSADVDGNGYPEFLFITEDMNFGSSSSYNDVTASWGSYGQWADDWSTSKFFMNLTGYSVNGADTALVQLAIRVYFHDNLGSDTNEVEYTDRTIFGVYLIDAETNKVVSSREWNYQELDDLEDTYPPNRNFVMLTATLVVPQKGTYYLAIGFLDPYTNYRAWWNYGAPWPCSSPHYDDGDFIVALEIAGLTIYARP